MSITDLVKPSYEDLEKDLDELEYTVRRERQDLFDLKNIFYGKFVRCEGCGHLRDRLFNCGCGHNDEDE